MITSGRCVEVVIVGNGVIDKKRKFALILIDLNDVFGADAGVSGGLQHEKSPGTRYLEATVDPGRWLRQAL
jgi:hypothetical protein